MMIWLRKPERLWPNTSKPDPQRLSPLNFPAQRFPPSLGRFLRLALLALERLPV
jgi:hypothetical protein